MKAVSISAGKRCRSVVPSIFRRAPIAVALLAMVVVFTVSPAIAQMLDLRALDQSQYLGVPYAVTATPLVDLLREAEAGNPDIAAARHGWQAATHIARQVSALPDPQFTVQQLSVGSPRPFAGFSNSDFAYIGLGVSQDIPYPGKRGLRARSADREAESLRNAEEAARRQVVEDVQATYFRLAYIQQTEEILLRNRQLLRETAEVAESHYRIGQGSQQEVLKAQLQSTRILRDIALQHQEAGQLQARLRQLLNRRRDTPDIVAEKLSFTPLRLSAGDLAARVHSDNPELEAQSQTLEKQKVQLELANKEARPDFNLQYMYQRTGNKFRDYYMLTLGVRLPRRSRQREAVSEAAEQLEKSKRQYESQAQQLVYGAQSQYLLAQADAEQLKVYNEGLIPQSEAMLRAGIAAYQTNQQNFETLLSYFSDSLTLQLEQKKLLADYNIAIAALERQTGVPLQ